MAHMALIWPYPFTTRDMVTSGCPLHPTATITKWCIETVGMPIFTFCFLDIIYAKLPSVGSREAARDSRKLFLGGFNLK